MNIGDYSKIDLPDSPGVYFFRDSKGRILYIGRATSLKDRVRSYFGNDLIQTRGMLLVDMVSKANKIEYIQTDSVLEAIILESNEIKKHQPYFNTKEKDNKSYNFVVITDEDFPRILIIRGRELDKLDENTLKFKIKYQFGPFPQGSLLKDALKIIRKIFPFRDEKANLKHQESFYKSIGLSPDISLEEYKKTIKNIVLFFEGKKKKLIKNLENEMQEYADKQKFEKAKTCRDTIYLLNHIQDISLIKKENINLDDNFRIEAFDIAHLSGKNNVGVMTVVIDGEVRKSEYRKFKVSTEKNNDIAGLEEILTRRFSHPEWPLPSLIVIDGGIAQKNIAEKVVKNTPIVSVVKDASHNPDHILGDKTLIDKHLKSILLANSESHRFAISYHKKLRNKNFIK